MSRQLKLGALINATGFHIAAWLHPNAPLADATDIDYYARLARSAERGLFDFLFLADSSAIMYGQDREAMSRIALVSHLEPVTLLSALAALTRNVGLVASATTTYNEPFHLARKFASLDHLSKGRAGWNIITSANQAEAGNFSRDEHVAHAQRYARAHEAVEIVEGLWDSWDDDAFVRDADSGIFFDPQGLHVLDHKGPHLSVRGPLHIARPVQGWPVIVQAGASEPGRQLAAETAEVVFAASATLEDGQRFYADVKGRMDAQGRDRDHLKILPGVLVVVGETDDQARAIRARLDSLVHYESAIASLSVALGCDASRFDPDAPLPPLPETNASKSSQERVLRLAERESLTVRQLAQRLGGYGGLAMVGTAARIADQMQEWLETEASDGFNVMFPWLPGGLDAFVGQVVPELQRRGIFRREYEGRTLRENLGLPRPANRHFTP